MSQHRIIRYALSSHTRIIIPDQQKFSPNEILFTDQVTNCSNLPAFFFNHLLESSIIRPIQSIKTSASRNVRIDRDAITSSFDAISSLLHIIDAILSINNLDISHLTHDQVTLTTEYITHMMPH